MGVRSEDAMLSKMEDEELSEGTAIGSSGALAGGSGVVDANRKRLCERMGWAVVRHDD